ncbi:MAG: hypothetical protein VYC80_13270 [Planctomycetota bacterium]|nr:hypothetical protein [Planctomycetota bacterium]
MSWQSLAIRNLTRDDFEQRIRTFFTQKLFQWEEWSVAAGFSFYRRVRRLIRTADRTGQLGSRARSFTASAMWWPTPQAVLKTRPRNDFNGQSQRGIRTLLASAYQSGWFKKAKVIGDGRVDRVSFELDLFEEM